MKAAILFSSIAVIIGSVLFASKPADAVVSGVTPKPITTGSQTTTLFLTNGSYSTSFTVECPIIGNPDPVVEPVYEQTVKGSETIYNHCKSCNIGVFLSSKEDEPIKCTYCGILNNPSNTNQ